MRTRVKICGITRYEDAKAAIDDGADALGFVFYEPSPRYITIDNAATIFNKIPPFINMVGLFVNADYNFVLKACNTLNINLLQFHGDESETYCSSFGKPYIKAIRIQKSTNLLEVSHQFHSASGLLIDAFDKDKFGGTGETFDWGLLQTQCDLPVILAGGLTPNNISDAISRTNPYAVDVSSGVEASKGVKSHPLIKQFMKEVKCADE